MAALRRLRAAHPRASLRTEGPQPDDGDEGADTQQAPTATCSRAVEPPLDQRVTAITDSSKTGQSQPRKPRPANEIPIFMADPPSSRHEDENSAMFDVYSGGCSLSVLKSRVILRCFDLG